MLLARLLISFVFVIAPMNLANAFDEINTGYVSDVTLEGYDAAAYFEIAAPKEGDSHYSLNWIGATWKFADQRSLDLFAANPDKYRPQYGGYCSNQMSLGNLSDIDPGVWLIHKDKLYLFGHDVGRQRWKDTGIDARIIDANTHWEKYLQSDG